MVINPVRAGMVEAPWLWPWSSFRLMENDKSKPPRWLDVDWLISCFGERRSEAVTAYTRFVLAGIGSKSPLEQVKHQLYLGDEAFIERLQRAPMRSESLREITKAQRRALEKPLSEYATNFPERNEAMARAYLSGAYTMHQIGEHFGVHYMTVTRAVRQFEQREML